jgi:hypothetical protein
MLRVAGSLLTNTVRSYDLIRMFAHGGLFKTLGVAQKFLAAAIDTPVSVGDLAAEGGAWGSPCWPRSCATGILDKT